MTFTISVDIAAPPERVWDVMSDAERWHEWTPSVRSIRLLDKPLAPGSRALIRQPKFPPALWKVTALEHHSFTWRTGSPGLWAIARHSVEPVGTGSRATLTLHYGGWFGGPWARLTRGLTERYLKFEAEGLKRRSEELQVRGT